jgi:hypothetical protein
MITLLQVSFTLLPPFGGGSSIAFAEHVYKLTKIPVYIHANAVEFLGPTAIEKTSNGNMLFRTPFMSVSKYDLKQPKNRPVVLSPGVPPASAQEVRSVLVLKPAMYSLTLAQQGTGPVNFRQLEVKEVEDTFEIKKGFEMLDPSGTLTLKNINNFGFSKKVEIPYYFRMMKVTVFDGFTQEDDFIEMVARSVGCFVKESPGAYNFHPIVSEVKERFINTLKFSDTNDGSLRSLKLRIKLSVLANLSDDIISKCITDENANFDVGLRPDSQLAKDCKEYVYAFLAKVTPSSDQVAKAINDLPKNGKIGVTIGAHFGMSMYIMDANDRPFYLP